MKRWILFNHSLKKWGWILVFPFIALGVINKHFGFEFEFLDIEREPIEGTFQLSQNLTDELAAIGIIISLMIIGFSKTRDEDEFTTALRATSLSLSMYIHYSLMLICIIFFFDEAFLLIIIYNMFTPLLTYVIILHYNLYRHKKGLI